jgi:hypothetical protein
VIWLSAKSKRIKTGNEIHGQRPVIMSIKRRRESRIRHLRSLQPVGLLAIGVLFQISLTLSYVGSSFSSLQVLGEGDDDLSPYLSANTDKEALLSYASRPASNLPPFISSFSSTNISSTGRLNVVDFGAIPNDGIDDTAAIKRTISALNVLSRVNASYNTVFLPAGTYSINDKILLGPNMIIEGEGRDKSLLQWTQRISTKRDVLQAQSTDLVPITDIIIRNLWINGTGPDTMGSCIRLDGVAGYKITNTKLTNCGDYPNGGGIHGQDNKNGEVSYNVIDNTRNGYITPAYTIISSLSIGTKDNLTPLNDTNTGTDQGLPVGNNNAPREIARRPAGSNNTLIAFNMISNSSDDAIHPQNGFHNTLIGNIAVDSHDDNIDTFLERNTIIQDNIIIMNFPTTKVTGFEIGDGSENILLKHNKVFGSSYGINIASDVINYAPRVNRNITIVDNEISGSILGCLRVVSSEYVRVNMNNFSKCNLVPTMTTGQQLTLPPVNTLNATVASAASDQNQSSAGYGILVERSSFLAFSDNSIQYIGANNNSTGILLRGADFVNITNNHIGLDLEQKISDGYGILVDPNSDHLTIGNNDLSGCGCIVKILSTRPNIFVSILEETTKIQAARIPFSFTYQVPEPSPGTDRSGDMVHYVNYTVSGVSVGPISSIQPISSNNTLVIELGRNQSGVHHTSSIDIRIPKQLMDKVSRITAYSAGYNITAAEKGSETMGNNANEPNFVVIQGSDDPIRFIEHQKKQNVPFQRLTTDPDFNIIRIIVPETAQRLEIKGIGAPAQLSFSENGLLPPSLSNSQIGILCGILSVIGASGGMILILGMRESRRKKLSHIK